MSGARTLQRVFQPGKLTDLSYQVVKCKVDRRPTPRYIHTSVKMMTCNTGIIILTVNVHENLRVGMSVKS